MLWLAAGCTLDPEIPWGLPDPVAAGTGVCGLLSVEEIEVALNRPLTGARGGGGTSPDSTRTPEDAEPQEATDAPGGDEAPEETATLGNSPGGEGEDGGPGSVRPILPGMRMCALGTQAGVDWGLLGDGAEESSAADDFRRYTGWHAEYLEPVSVERGEAFWDQRLRTLVALTDGHVVGIRLVPADPTAEEGEQQAEEAGSAMTVREQAVDLANRAIRRL